MLRYIKWFFFYLSSACTRILCEYSLPFLSLPFSSQVNRVEWVTQNLSKSLSIKYFFMNIKIDKQIWDQISSVLQFLSFLIIKFKGCAILLHLSFVYVCSLRCVYFSWASICFVFSIPPLPSSYSYIFFQDSDLRPVMSVSTSAKSHSKIKRKKNPTLFIYVFSTNFMKMRIFRRSYTIFIFWWWHKGSRRISKVNRDGLWNVFNFRTCFTGFPQTFWHVHMVLLITIFTCK